MCLWIYLSVTVPVVIDFCDCVCGYTCNSVCGGPVIFSQVTGLLLNVDVLQLTLAVRDQLASCSRVEKVRIELSVVHLPNMAQKRVHPGKLWSVPGVCVGILSLLVMPNRPQAAVLGKFTFYMN